MNEIKLIASDMDGTFLYDEHTISPGNQKALWDAWNRGIHIAFCSGRSPIDLKGFTKRYTLPPCYFLGYNGTYCLDQEGALFSVDYINPPAVKACARIFEEENVVFGLMGTDRMALNRDPKGKDVANKGSISYVVEAWENSSWDKDNVTKTMEEGVCKLLYIDQNGAQRLQNIRSKIESIRDITIMSSWHNNIELVPKGVSKGTAVEKLARALKISAENVMTIGDQENDVEMLRYAGYGVAVANGAPKALEAAKYQTGHHRDDGVAQAIYRYAFGQM